MTGGFATKRRAEEFDALLTGDASAESGEYAELLDMVADIRALPEVHARPEFVATLRDRLVAEAAAMPAPASTDRATAAHLTPVRPTVRRERRIATVLSGFAVASAATSMAVASQAAVPGDVLYPVKRAIESAQVSLQSDQGDRSATLLDLAERRVAETRQLTIDGAPATTINAALREVEEHSAKAADLTVAHYRTDGDTAGMTRLSAFTDGAIADLTTLSPLVPTDSRPALMSAVQLLRNIQAATQEACPACDTASTAPLLVSHLSPLLTGESDDLRSLARLAEEVAEGTPSPEVTDSSDGSPTEGSTSGTAPTPDGTPSPTPGLDNGSSSLDDIESTLVDGATEALDPVTTLLDEITHDLETLNQQALEEWEKAYQEWRDSWSN